MRARLATALVLLSLATAGCAGGASGEETGPTLPPVTAAPSPSAAAVPPEATEATPEGAAEFVRFFYETVESSYQTHDAKAIRALSASDCEACLAFAETVEGLRRDGARVREDYEVDVVSVEAPDLEPGQDTLTVLAVVNVSEFVRLGADGRVTTSEAPLANAVQNVTLRRTKDAWIVQAMTQA